MTFFEKCRSKLLSVWSFHVTLAGALLTLTLLEHSCFLNLNKDSNNYYSPSVMEDYTIWIIGAVEFAVGACVAWLGRGRRQLCLSVWIALAAVAGIFPLFDFWSMNGRFPELCSFIPITELPTSRFSVDRIYDVNAYRSSAAFRTTFFVFTLVFSAVAKISIWAHGLTSSDDKEPQNGPYFYGLLIAVQVSLGLTGKEWLQATANSEEGWVPHLCLCLITLAFSALFFVFPRISPKDDGRQYDDRLLPSLKRVLTNRTVNVQVGAISFMHAAIFRFYHYDNFFIQARYHVDSMRMDLRSSWLIGSIFRPIVVIFFILIFCNRFSVRRSDGVKASMAARVGGVVALFAAALFVALATMDCGAGDITGITDGSYEPPYCRAITSCSSCDNVRHGFIPVCGLNSSVTYLSPCDAGCRSYDNLNGFLVFRDCSCDSEGVTRGACALPGCHLVYTLHQVFVTLILAIGGAAMMLQGMAVLRAVRRVDKPVAMGVLLATAGLTSQLLGHLLYYTINRVTCVLSDVDRCQFHNPSIYVMAVISAVFAALSALFSMLVGAFRSKVSAETETR